MTTATTVRGGETAGPVAGRLIPRLAIALWALAVFAMGFGLWAVLRDDTPPAYYVVKWEKSGKCGVVTAQPERGKARLLWFTMMYESAARKSREFRENLRCN